MQIVRMLPTEVYFLDLFMAGPGAAVGCGAIDDGALVERSPACALLPALVPIPLRPERTPALALLSLSSHPHLPPPPPLLLLPWAQASRLLGRRERTRGDGRACFLVSPSSSAPGGARFVSVPTLASIWVWSLSFWTE